VRFGAKVSGSDEEGGHRDPRHPRVPGASTRTPEE
jgi:hypothetical protein